MKSPLPQQAYQLNAEVYKLLANPKRLEILNLLREQELSVEELIKVLRLPKVNVSQHLTILRQAQLVTVRRNGLSAYYNISDPRIVEPCRILHQMRQRNNNF